MALAALLLAVVIGGRLLPVAYAQDEWRMIDEDQVFVEEVSRDFVSPASLNENAWTGGLGFLAMARNDDLDVLWGVPRNRSTLETNLNSGLQLDLTFEPIASDSATTDVRRLSFIAIQGVGNETIFGETYESSASVIGGSVLLGTKSPLLRGQSRTLMGMRYLNIADQIDVFDSGRLLQRDWVRATNHLVTLDAAVEGIWYWRRIRFSSSLSAGVGFNQAMQSGWLASGTATEYEVTDLNFSTVAEFKSAAGLNMTDHTRIQIGLQGLLATGVQQVRGAYGGPGDTDEVRLVGMTFSIEQEF